MQYVNIPIIFQYILQYFVYFSGGSALTDKPSYRRNEKKYQLTKILCPCYNFYIL